MDCARLCSSLSSSESKSVGASSESLSSSLSSSRVGRSIESVGWLESWDEVCVDVSMSDSPKISSVSTQDVWYRTMLSSSCQDACSRSSQTRSLTWDGSCATSCLTFVSALLESSKGRSRTDMVTSRRIFDSLARSSGSLIFLTAYRWPSSLLRAFTT